MPPQLHLSARFAEFYEIRYQAEPAVLLGRSRRSLTPSEFTEACELLLRTAQRYGCRFWVLDGRENQAARPAGMHEWLEEDFLPRVNRLLGRVPCVAFLVAGAAGPPSQGYVPLPGLQAAVPFKAGWFGTEQEALGWLDQFRP